MEYEAETYKKRKSGDIMKKSEKIILGISIGFWSMVIIAVIAFVITVFSMLRNEFKDLNNQYTELERISETNMPDEMGINDIVYLKKRLSTEYTVKDAEGETLILCNHAVKGIWGPVSNYILTDLKGNQLNDSYENYIKYGDYIPAYRSSMVSDRLAVNSDNEDHVQAYSVYGEEMFDGTREEFKSVFSEVLWEEEKAVTAQIIEEMGKQYLVYIDFNQNEIFRSDCYIENNCVYSDESKTFKPVYGAQDEAIYELPVLTDEYDVNVYDRIIVFRENNGVSTVYSVEVK